MIVIGADTHKDSHALAAVDEGTGRVRGSRQVRAEAPGHLAAVRWARSLDDERVWAIEDCRHVSRRRPRPPRGRPVAIGLLGRVEGHGLGVARLGMLSRGPWRRCRRGSCLVGCPATGVRAGHGCRYPRGQLVCVWKGRG